MSVSPRPTPLTSPEDDTVATVALDDCQLDWVVTSCVVALASVAVAVNCDEAPTDGAVPLIAIDFTVGFEDELGVVETSPQAHIKSISRTAAAVAPSSCRIS